MTAREWQEYDGAAAWCAKRGIKGKCGDPLPSLLSAAVAEEIANNQDEFEERVRLVAYAIAMQKSNP